MSVAASLLKKHSMRDQRYPAKEVAIWAIAFRSNFKIFRNRLEQSEGVSKAAQNTTIARKHTKDIF